MSDYAYQNLKTYSNAGSGIAEYALIAPVSWFAAGGIKAPVAPFGVTPGDSITIKTAHTFIAGKGFIYYKLAPQKNQMDGKTVGDVGFNKQNYEVKIFIPGSTPAQHENIMNLLNVPLIVIVKDINCGANLYYQLGCDCTSAYMSADFSTGTSNSGVKGYNGLIHYESSLQIYDAGDPEQLAG
jgi:hypothetical protein